MEITLLDSGPAYSLYAIVDKGECQIKEYLNGLSGKDLTQILALLERILEHGPPTNERKFKKVGNKVFELKTPSGIRIVCFYGGPNLSNSLVLTHGTRKAPKKKFQREIKKASACEKEYSESDEIKIIEGE